MNKNCCPRFQPFLDLKITTMTQKHQQTQEYWIAKNQQRDRLIQFDAQKALTCSKGLQLFSAHLNRAIKSVKNARNQIWRTRRHVTRTSEVRRERRRAQREADDIQ